MRERLAMIVFAVVIAVLVGLAVAFAWRHNQEPPLAAPIPAKPATANRTAGVEIDRTDRGREIFRVQNCSLCHSLGGSGNPRYPLDGIGAKLNEEDLRNGILGSGPFAERISGPVIGRKERYSKLPDDDLAALVAYLAAQR